MTELASDRPALRVPFLVVAAVSLALGGLALFAGSQLYAAFGPAMPRAMFHIPNDSTYAARVARPNPELEAAIEPLLRVLNAPRDPARPPRAEALAKKSGVSLERAVREIAVSRGPAADDWLVTASGDLPETGLLEAARAVLIEEGWQWELDAARRSLVSPEGLALGQASDGTLILASSTARLNRAQKRDTGDPAPDVARGVEPVLDELRRSSGELAIVLSAHGKPRR